MALKKSTQQTKAKEAFEKFLFPLKILKFNISDVKAYVKIRADLESKGNVIGAMDMLIASQALSRKYTIVTNNLREFERIDGLKCENWV